MKRVFTKHLEGIISPVGDPAAGGPIATDQWLLQENVTIIGGELMIGAYPQVTMVESVDSTWEFEGYFTQALGVLEAYFAQCAINWHASAAVGQNSIQTGNVNDHGSFMFPEGFGIPVREEGVITLEAWYATVGVTASFKIEGILFYVKGLG